ncbi:MAG TPA: VOC family protein [Candidatus Limnocylindrales bacterium]|nr:VOC family protein [Candidatus Limnocylindrales bacterium]
MNLSNHEEHYIKLQVTDLETWIKFYTTDLGFEPLYRDKFTVLLSDGYTILKLWEDESQMREVTGRSPLPS